MIRRSWLLVLIGLVVAALALGAVACSDDDDDTDTEEPTAAEAGETPTAPAETAEPTGTQTGAENLLCQEIATLDAAATALADALSNPSSSVWTIRSANDAVETAFTTGQVYATAVYEERVTELEAAQADLEAAMAALPDTATRDEAIAAVQPQVDALVEATANALSDLGCA
jgi:hypothetical protein